MNEALTQVLLGLVATGFFADIFKGLLQRKRISSAADLDEANATQVIVTSTKALLGPLTERLERAEAKVAHLEAELVKATRQAEEIVDSLEKCNRENRRLANENRRLRLKPQQGGSPS